MKNLTRFGVSIEANLIKRFDRWIAGTGYRNRSEAFRDLIRGKLVEQETGDAEAEVVGVLSMVYDHHKPDLERKLTDMQHAAHHSIIAATHVHLDHHNCLEVILLKGQAGALKNLGDSLASLKGVKHSHLSFTSEKAVS